MDASRMGEPAGHWGEHARRWRWFGSPLRPAAEDVAILGQAVADWQATARVSSPRALLLGVTPEIAMMPWPSGTRLTAVDHSEAMIRGVWPAPGSAAACRARWTALPLAGATQDVAACDGGFTGLDYPRGYRAVAGELRRVLRAGGLLVARCFVSPGRREAVGAVMDDLLAGRIGGFHVFKWRLAMALHADARTGVRLADVWDAWHAAVAEPAALARRLGWPLESVNTIDAYRGIEARYTFPTLDEVRAVMTAAFEEAACRAPGYELGERCPTLSWRAR